jgi:multicomponent Na+:H+ antiporter subunit C
MSQFLLYALASLGLVCIGLHNLLVRPHLLRKILALNVMSSGIFLFLVAVARRNERSIPDPVPHAMVLTGIVVAVSVTALALGIVRRMHRESQEATLDEEEIE